MKYLCIIVLFFLSLGKSNAQDSSLTVGHGSFSTTTVGSTITELNLPAPIVEGTYYLEDDWKMGSIFLRTDSISNYYFKYNVGDNNFEIKVENDVKLLNGDRVNGFYIANSIERRDFIAASQLPTLDRGLYIGFFEVLLNGKMKLLKRHSFIEKKANYNAITDSGSRNHEIVKKEILYTYEKGKLIELKGNKIRKSLGLFGKQTSKVTSYSKEKNLSPKTEKDIIKLISYYNSLK